MLRIQPSKIAGEKHLKSLSILPEACLWRSRTEKILLALSVGQFLEHGFHGLVWGKILTGHHRFSHEIYGGVRVKFSLKPIHWWMCGPVFFPRNSVLIPRPTNIYLFGSHRKIPLSFSRKEEEFSKKKVAKKIRKIVYFQS